MKHLLLTAILLLLHFHALYSQRYTVKEGVVDFFSHAPLEDISAENKNIQSLFNVETGEIAFRIRISDFRFSKKLMQEHFNEKYMESDKYPYATFSGSLGGFNANASGEQQVTATGKLTIHGVTHDVSTPGTVRRNGEYYQMDSSFMVRLEDYGIAIPQLLWQNIAEEVKVTIRLTYTKS
jgi:polyisoprenoid-binding protein YceI